MSDWKPGLYLKFEKERTQPAIDLVMNFANDYRHFYDILSSEVNMLFIAVIFNGFWN